MEALTATVLVTRHGGVLRDSARSYRLLLDGEQVGAVRPRRALRIAVPAGTHTVQARVSSAGSRKYRFTAEAGQEYSFEVMPNGPALSVFTGPFGDNFIRLTPPGNLDGDWDNEIDRSPVVSVRALLYSGLVPGLLGALAGVSGVTAGQRLSGIGLGLAAALTWTLLVRSGRLRSKRRNTPPPIWHNLVRLVLVLVGALLAALALTPRPAAPITFDIGNFLSCYVIASILAIYAQKWIRLAAARLR